MNKDVANTLCPIYKTEIFQYSVVPIEGVFSKTMIKVKARLLCKNTIDSEWNLIYDEDIDCILTACAHILTVYKRAVNKEENINLGSEKIELRDVGNNFPLRKIIIEEYLYGKDNGNSWDDPENDIRKKVTINYYIQRGINSDWALDYEERYNFFDYAVLNSGLMHIKLFERIPFEFDPISWNSKKDEDIAMFQAEGHMFKFISHIYDQKCVVGEAITADYHNDYEDDKIIKVSYLEDLVFVYHKDEMVLFMNKLYMNGACLCDIKDLEILEIDKFDIEWGNDNFKKWIMENYPGTKKVNTLMSLYRIVK